MNSPPNMTNQEYHADPNTIGKSGLEYVLRSPAHFYERFLSGKPTPPPTPAMRFGTLIHTATLEPDQLARYVVVPDEFAENKRGNAWKEWKLAHEGLEVVDASDLEAALQIAKNIREHPKLVEVFREGVAEKPIFALDPETFVPLRIKPDWFNRTRGLILDVKTCTDARADAFARDVVNYRYHMQDALYTDVARLAGYDIQGFAFVAVEKEPPYAVAIHVLDEPARNRGRELYRKALNRYAICLETGLWPAYDPEPTDLTLPNWAFR